jgi:TOMM system kinase/cyclase fusion protein
MLMAAKSSNEETPEGQEEEEEHQPPLDPTMSSVRDGYRRIPVRSDTPPTPKAAPVVLEETDPVTVSSSRLRELIGRPLGSMGPLGTMVVPLSATSANRRSGTVVPKKGDRVGGDDGRRFEMIERLGAGGMAVVLLAKDTVLDRTVAIKFITHEIFGSGSAEAIERVKLEARASARLSHENIVRVFDLGTANGVPFLVMEHLEGRPLDLVAMHEKLDALRAVRIMTDVARGLSHAHKSGIVHRDLKPSNVFILKDGRAKLVDFGLASVAYGLDSRGAEWHALAGTPRYMSPEQWRGEAQDGRTDIWAAGVMFFEMLVGHPPFQGDRILDVRSKVLSPEAAPLLRHVRPDLPEEAERIIERALAKDVAKRLDTADELLYALVALEVSLSRSMRAATQDARGSSMPPPKPERRQMTFLSCSLSGLMELSEQLDLDDFTEQLDGFFEVCATVVRQLEGTILSTLGGRAVACFGYPVAHEDDAQRAVRAGFLIVAAIRGLTSSQGVPHAAQIGVHTSLAVAAKLADGIPRATPIILGEAPHVATWLDRTANANEILISQRTQMLVRGLFEVEPHGAHTPDGATRAIDTFRAIRPEPTSTRFDRGPSRQLTPLVGREGEVATLRGLWNRAKRGEGQLAMLVGEAGIGKSRMVALLKEQISTDPHIRIGCQSWLHFKNSALHPIIDGMMRLIGARAETPAPDKLQKLETFLSGLALPSFEYVPLLASFLSIPLTTGYSAPALSPDLLKNKVLEAVVATLLQLAAQQPMLFVIEDVHWSDVSTLELLGLLLGRMAGSSLLVIATFRPDFTPPWPGRSHLHRIALQRLSSSQTAAMAALASHGRKLPAEVMDQLVRRTDGVPLFVEELTRMVADAWQDAEENGPVMSARSFASETIPATLAELLLARLDRLSDNGKEVVQLGAVLGREFSYRLIQLASHLDEAALGSGLMQILEAGMIQHEGQGEDTQYVFKHALLQEAAYQSLVKGRRQEHHLRAAEAIVEHFPEIAAQHPELVGHHFAEASKPAEAIPYLVKAGQQAVQRSANFDAVIHYSRAIAELTTLPEGQDRDRRELSLQLALGAPLMATKGTAAPQVRETYERSRELCQVVGDDAQLFPALLGLTQFYMVAGEPAIAVELGRQLLAQAERAGDETMRMLAHRSLGTSISLLGEFTLWREHNEKALAIYDRAQHGKLMLKYGQDPGVWSLSYLGWCLWFLGFPDQALQRSQDAVRLAKEISHPVSIALSTNYLAILHNYRGEHAIACELADRAMEICTEHKLTLWMTMSKIQRGWALLGINDRPAGMEQLKEGVAGWTKTGAKSALTFFLATLTWGLWQASRLDEAISAIGEAEALVASTGERWFEAELCRLRGEVMLALDPTSEAVVEECFRRGLAIARRQQCRAWELRTATSLGRFLSLRGRTEEAKSTLQPVLDWFQEGMDTADLREARALLTAWQS